MDREENAAAIEAYFIGAVLETACGSINARADCITYFGVDPQSREVTGVPVQDIRQVN